ncbi:hypothetical protein [Kaistella sp.]|uniref:hypothetical protein n=1 Tax=Kaistella sp. TaxID=2782235 RepID=UPI002F95FC36
MNFWHKRLVYFQVLLLLAVVTLQIFFPGVLYTAKVVMMFAFFFTEFAVLELQRSENPDAVYYRKSCVFALLDLLAVSAFILSGILWLIGICFEDNLLNPLYVAVILLYTAIRKLYIIKNYSYEI